MNKFKEIIVNKIWIVLISNTKKFDDVIEILYFCADNAERVEDYFLEYYYKKNSHIIVNKRNKSVKIKAKKEFINYYSINGLKAIVK